MAGFEDDDQVMSYTYTSVYQRNAYSLLKMSDESVAEEIVFPRYEIFL